MLHPDRALCLRLLMLRRRVTAKSRARLDSLRQISSSLKENRAILRRTFHRIAPPQHLPWLTVVSDDYSRAVAGYFLSFEAPSSIQTALALRQAIWRKEDPRWHVCGIPEILYSDNGTDFGGPRACTLTYLARSALMSASKTNGSTTPAWLMAIRPSRSTRTVRGISLKWHGSTKGRRQASPRRLRHELKTLATSTRPTPE